MILYTLVSGSLPFDGQNLKELRERVLRGKYRIPFYMSTDCENLLKKFLVLNPTKRASLEVIMKDKWMNVGYEEDELKPYIEPEPDFSDQNRMDFLTRELKYSKEQVEDSLKNRKYDEVMATFMLLATKNSEVSFFVFKIQNFNVKIIQEIYIFSISKNSSKAEILVLLMQQPLTEHLQ